QVFGGAALHDVLHLIEDLALIATAIAAGVDVVAAHIGHAVGQARHAVLGKVQGIADLPGVFVLGVEVRPVGVGQPDGAASVTHGPFALVEAVVVARAAAAALVGQSERVRVDGVGTRQAPDT